MFIPQSLSSSTRRTFVEWPTSTPGVKYRKELQRPLASRMDPNREWYPYQGRAYRRGLSIAHRLDRLRAHHRSQLTHNPQDQCGRMFFSGHVALEADLLELPERPSQRALLEMAQAAVRRGYNSDHGPVIFLC